jgi:glycine/D-amino acid oxidase-like deaminating enzyme
MAQAESPPALPKIQTCERSAMTSHYQAMVIGGGVVGTSVLYHLAKFGWKDVCLIECDILTCGSSWHAAGGFHALNADPNIAGLQSYTIDLLSEIEKESEQSVGMHMTGGMTLAGTPDRWEWLRSAYRVFQSIGIDDVRLIPPEQAGELCPLMSTHGVLGGMWADREGHVDTTGTVHAYAGAAKKHGTEIIEHNRVLELTQTADGWDVVTENGTIHTEHVVNAAGLWAKQVGRMAGIELPVSPLNHHYLISDTLPELGALDKEVPLVVDLEGFTYMRQDQNGMLLGIYEIDHDHWMMDGAPWDYGMQLQQEDPDRIERELTLGFERYPALQNVGVKTSVNGAFTFSPDDNPLVGPVRGKPGDWCARAVMAGYFQGGGTVDIGMIRTKVGRLSVSGELGFDIHCTAPEHITLRETLLEAGADFGICEVGFNALLSLRLEKSFGIWSAEFTQAYTPGQTGMDRWIARDKGALVGRDAAIAERDSNTPAQKLVTIEIDAKDADASGFDPAWQNGSRVGLVTSGGYGHTIGESMAMAMVDQDACAEETDLIVHIVGQEQLARVIAPSPYAPEGMAMRA